MEIGQDLGEREMRFEIKGYDVNYSKDNGNAMVSRDGEEVMGVHFEDRVGIYDVVGGVAICMVSDNLLSEDDIKDVMEACGIPMDNVRKEIKRLKENSGNIPLS